MNPFLVILIIVVIAIAAYFIWQMVKKSRDPEYAAKMNKKKAAKNIERQKRKLERAEQRAIRAKYEETIAPAKADYLKAKQDYNARVKHREDELNKLQRDHDRAVRDQEKAINEIEKQYSQFVCSVGSLKLFADRVTTKDAAVNLNNTLFAEIYSGGDLANFGGKYVEFAFEQQKEDGESPENPGTIIGGVGKPEAPWRIVVNPEYSYLFLIGTVIEMGNQQLDICVPLDGKNYDDAMNFMEALNNAAQNAEATERRRSRDLEDARAKLEQIKADTGALEEAQESIDRERDNSATVDEAQAKLEAAEKAAQAETGYVPRTRKDSSDQ